MNPYPDCLHSNAWVVSVDFDKPPSQVVDVECVECGVTTVRVLSWNKCSDCNLRECWRRDTITDIAEPHSLCMRCLVKELSG